MFGSLVLDASQPQAMFRLQAGLLEWRVSEDGSQRPISLVPNFPKYWTPQLPLDCVQGWPHYQIGPTTGCLRPYFIILTDSNLGLTLDSSSSG